MFKQMGVPSPSPRRVPLHVRAEQHLRALIRQRAYQDGALLPDEISLAGRLGVSRGTLRAALTRLVLEGLLERRAGIGTRVVQPPSESGITAWRSFSREMAAKGMRVENLSQDYRRAALPGPAAAALRLRPGEPAWRLDRVRGWEGSPVLHSRSWFHPRLGLTGAEDFSRPLYETIESVTGRIAEHAHESFAAVSAPSSMARHLAVPRHTPLLLRSHTVFDRSRRPMEFAEVHYVSARFTLTLELRRGEEPG